MEKPLTKHIIPGSIPISLKNYRQAGGYIGTDKALKTMSPSEVTNMVKASNLLGRGGAGFPTGVKWSLVPMDDERSKPKYLVCNADEMEPGTFKDRYLLEGNPHQLIAGMIIAAYAIQAEKAYIFLRWAYKKAEAELRKAIAEAYNAGYLEKIFWGQALILIYTYIQALAGTSAEKKLHCLIHLKGKGPCHVLSLLFLLSVVFLGNRLW